MGNTEKGDQEPAHCIVRDKRSAGDDMGHELKLHRVQVTTKRGFWSWES